MKKRVFLLLFMCVLISTAVLGLTFETSLKPFKNKIYLDEEAMFILNLRNDLPTIENFVVYTTEVTWSLNSEPASDRNPKLYPESSRQIELELKPTSYITPGTYSVPISIKNAETNELRVLTANVEIVSDELPNVNYLPGLRSTVHIDNEVDPRGEVPIKVDVINQNPLNITELTVVLRSNLINKEYSTSLSPLETKTINFNVMLDPLTIPQEDILYTTIKISNYNFEPQPNAYNIIAYGDIKSTKELRRGFLKTEHAILIENTGNELNSDKIRERLGLVRGLFSSTKPRAQKVMFDNERHVQWSVTLEAGSSAEVVLVTNYQYLFITLVLIVLIIVSYFSYRSPIIVKKSAIIIGRKHGGISDLSVRMAIINRSKYNVLDLLITDKLPSLVDLHKDFEEGTLRPSSILKHDKKGTIMKWQIRTLEPGEERIIHYKVKTRLSILGSLSLPITVVKFKREGKKARVVGSNRLIIRA
ncbi:MAG: hypothetical protein QF632_06880 [Candidatus Woesearchaeota archaeon]|nr:hypothetical protein [Candidatus Woesearchaeota archaeon]